MKNAKSNRPSIVPVTYKWFGDLTGKNLPDGYHAGMLRLAAYPYKNTMVYIDDINMVAYSHD